MIAQRQVKVQQSIFVAKRPPDMSGLGMADALGKELPLHLSIRTIKFEDELTKMKLPSGKNGLMEQLQRVVSLRRMSFEVKYESVCLFTSLKQFGTWWQDYASSSGKPYGSLEEFLSDLDLSNGATLGRWEVLVRLFDRDTFLLVGDELLYYMTRNIAGLEAESSKRRQGYQAIFDAYCKKYSVFDKRCFESIINWYINTRYSAQPEAEPDPMRRPPKTTQRGYQHRTFSTAGKFTGQEQPGSEPDIKVKVTQCAGCKQRDAKLEAWERREKLLLEFINKHVSADIPRPERPKILDVPIL